MPPETAASHVWWTDLIGPTFVVGMLIYSLATGCLPLRGWRIYRSEEPFYYWFMMGVGVVLLALILIFQWRFSN